MHHHDAHDAYIRYRTGLTINLAVVVLQICVWTLLARAVGLLEDFAHGFGDNLNLAAITIILYFEAIGATPNKGRRRMVAIIGGLLLVVGGLWGGYIAYERIVGVQIDFPGLPLAITSFLAIIGNGWAYKIIHGVDKSLQDHAHKSTTAHLAGDLAISVTVFFSSIGIMVFALPAIDSFVTLFLIAPWMIFRGVQVLKYKDPPESAHGDAPTHHNHDHHH